MPSVQRFEHSVTLLLAQAGTSDVAMLTYDPVLSRVRIDQSVLATVNGSPPPAGATRVIERSTDLAYWTTVRGGDEALVDAGAGMLDDYEFTPTGLNYYRIRVLVAGDLYWTLRDQIVAPVTAVWVKWPTQPFLNRTVTVVDFGDVTDPSRSGVFDVVGRSLAVAVTDVRGSDRFELQLLVDTPAAETELKLCLSGGAVVLVQAPGEASLPSTSAYYCVGDLTRARPFRLGAQRVFTLPLTEVTGPDAALPAATITWRGLANRYATWTDVIAANATWADVMALRGTPQDLVVP